MAKLGLGIIKSYHKRIGGNSPAHPKSYLGKSYLHAVQAVQAQQAAAFSVSVVTTLFEVVLNGF